MNRIDCCNNWGESESFKGEVKEKACIYLGILDCFMDVRSCGVVFEIHDFRERFLKAINLTGPLFCLDAVSLIT